MTDKREFPLTLIYPAISCYIDTIAFYEDDFKKKGVGLIIIPSCASPVLSLMDILVVNYKVIKKQATISLVMLY